MSFQIALDRTRRPVLCWERRAWTAYAGHSQHRAAPSLS